MTPDDERLVGPEEVAARLGIAPRTAKEWMRDGTVPDVLKIGGRGMLRVRESDFAAYLASLPGISEAVTPKAKP